MSRPAREFFRLRDAVKTSDVFDLRDEQGRTFDTARLRSPERMRDVRSLGAKVEWVGAPPLIAFTELSFPFAEARMADMLQALAPGAFARIPAKLKGVEGTWCYLQFRSHLDCIHKERAELELYTKADGFADSVGEIMGVDRLVLRASAIPQDVRMFRAQGWPNALLVDDVVAGALHAAEVQGIVLEPVDVA